MMDLRCRACSLSLAPNGAVSLSIFNKDKIRLSDILMKVAPISIFECDALPKVICLNCFDKMNSAYEFREKVIDADFKLRQEDNIEQWRQCNQNYSTKLENITEDPLKLSEDVQLSILSLIKPESKEELNEFKSESNYIESNELNLKYPTDNSDVLKEIPTQFPISSNSAKEEDIKVEYCNLGEVNFEKVAVNTSLVIPIEQKISREFKLEIQAIETQPKLSLRVRKKNYGSKIDDPAICEQCGKTFKNKLRLRIHNYQHSSQGFNCEICHKKFVLRENLKIHSRIHSNERPFKCNLCDSAFKQKSALNSHNRIHQGIKPYICPACGKSFRQVAGLKVHERTHTGEKPYVCEFCSASFSELGALRMHFVTHPDANLPSLPCDICGKTFRHPRHLTVHVKKKHSEKQLHECGTCGKKFTEKKSVTVHMRLHTGEKPYRCKVCEKSFYHGSILMRHMRTHTGETPYPCTVCEQRFAYSHHLLNHLKRKHPSVDPEKNDNSSNL